MRRGLAASFCLLAACHGDREVPVPVAPSPVSEAADASPRSDELVGVVDGPDGSAASGVVVALVHPRGQRLALTRTDAHGHFRVPRPREPFAVTVTGDQGTALFISAPDANTSLRRPAHLRLGEQQSGVVVSGTLEAFGGAPPAGTVVSAARLSKDEGDLFYGTVSAEGAFELVLPPGTYVLSVDSSELDLEPARVTGAAGAHVEVALHASRRTPGPDAVVGWLKESAIPIATTDVHAPGDDLAPLVAAFGSARVIGLGEATHGTLEYTEIKQRLVERLALGGGTIVFAMEANFAASERVNDYVQTGHGTPEDAVRSLFRVWQTEEVRDLIVWMRTWNANPHHRHKIRFRGYDVQGARESLAALRAYLRRVDPKGEALLAPLEPLDATTNARGMLDLTEAQERETGDAAARLVAHFAAQKARYVARSSVAAFDLAAEHAHVVQQAQARFSAHTAQERFVARDRAMADNVLWLLGQAGPDARVVVWAHNGHIQLGGSALPGPNMGSRLRERLGSDYVPVGFVLDEGKYRACPDPKQPSVTVEVPLDRAAPGDVAEAFARTGFSMFAVDLRRAPRGVVSDWLTAPHMLRSCGWIVSEAERRGYPDSLGRLFDMAIYLAHTTPSQPLRR